MTVHAGSRMNYCGGSSYRSAALPDAKGGQCVIVRLARAVCGRARPASGSLYAPSARQDCTRSGGASLHAHLGGCGRWWGSNGGPEGWLRTQRASAERRGRIACGREPATQGVRMSDGGQISRHEGARGVRTSAEPRTTLMRPVCPLSTAETPVGTCATWGMGVGGRGPRWSLKIARMASRRP